MGITRLSQDEQAAVLDRIATDPVVTAKDALRAAMKRYARWPFSRTRRRALFAAWEENEDTQTNRVMATAGMAVVGPLEALKSDLGRLRAVQARQAAQMGRMEVRIAQLETQALHELAVGASPRAMTGTPMDWVQIATTFGSTFLVLAGVGWFLLSKVWPFVMSQVERGQAERTREREQFVSALNRQNDTTDKMVGALRELANSMNQIRDDNRSRDRNRTL